MSHLQALLLSHPDWIAPRSDQHTVIGLPDSRDHRKTFVEPGGSFSPGVGSFGVSVWVYDHRKTRLFAPEEMAADELDWHWQDGYLPILNSRWGTSAFRVEQQLFAAPLSSLENIVNSLKLTLINRAEETRSFSLYLVIRPYGAAGGKIYSLQAVEPEAGLMVNGKTVLLARSAWNELGTLSYSDDGQEISTWLRKGRIPPTSTVEDKVGLCSGALAYNLDLAPGAAAGLEFDFFVHPLEQDYLTAFRAYHSQTYASKLEQISRYWEERLKQVWLKLPDKRFSDAFYSMLAQHLIATVNGEVRIGTITYPLMWIRDGVYILNALDKAGFHQEVRAQLAHLQPNLFAGGFGAEPDAFGETIWAFYTHYGLTNDREWLASVYPDLQKRAEWIIKARHTDQYLYADTPTRVPDRRYAADSDLICEPARDGLIQGRMDWHRPLMWINAFALLGLNAMSEMAATLGKADHARLYNQEADELRVALHHYAEGHFGQNERDFVCAIWPSKAFTPQQVHKQYCDWWQKVRLDQNGEYSSEPLWKYFELGQAHNYLLLGERAKALQTVSYYLEHHDVYNLYGWLEDDHDIAEHWSQIEGWYKLPSRQPHGWVASEFLLLLRDLWLNETDGSLVLGQGFPDQWLEPGNSVEIHNMPSAFGRLDFTLAVSVPQRIEVKVAFHSLTQLPGQIVLCLPWSQAHLHTSVGSVEQDKVVIPLFEYAVEGKVYLTINFGAL